MSGFISAYQIKLGSRVWPERIALKHLFIAAEKILNVVITTILISDKFLSWFRHINRGAKLLNQI